MKRLIWATSILAVLGLVIVDQLRRARSSVDGGRQPATEPGVEARSGASPEAATIDRHAPSLASAQSPTAPATAAEPSAAIPAASAASAPETIWSPAEARARMQALERIDDCLTARRALDPALIRPRERQEWRWLPPAQVERERAGAEAARQRLLANCSTADSEAPSPARLADHAEVLRAAARAGDLRARLRSLRRGPRGYSAAQRSELRALLHEVMLSGDWELIARISQYQSDLYPPTQFMAVAFELPTHDAWMLAACDLGMDCGPASRALALHCLTASAVACDAPNLEMALWRAAAPSLWRRAQRERIMLVDRLRTGNVHGILDLPPAPPPGP